MNLSRGFLKKFRTFLIISATSPLRTTCFCATTLSLPAPRIGFTPFGATGYRVSLGFQFVTISVSTVHRAFRRRGSPLDTFIIAYFVLFVKHFFFWCDGLESNQQVPVGGFHSGVCGFTLGVHALDYHHILSSLIFFREDT